MSKANRRFSYLLSLFLLTGCPPPKPAIYYDKTLQDNWPTITDARQNSDMFCHISGVNGRSFVLQGKTGKLPLEPEETVIDIECADMRDNNLKQGSVKFYPKMHGNYALNYSLAEKSGFLVWLEDLLTEDRVTAIITIK